jgi:putative hydrolase
MREAREATDTELIGALLTATANAMRRHAGLTIAHLFSVLPKVGLHEESVSDAQVHQLATLARATGATLEISERWRCPSLRVARIFAQERVPLVASSDAHRPTDIGRYDHVARVAAELAAGPATGAGA